MLTLVAPPGVDLIGSITIIAIDRDCRKLAATRYFNSPSRIHHGGCCKGEVRPPSKLTFEDAAVALTNAHIAQRVYTAGISRLTTVASVGKVADLQPVSIADAVGSQIRRLWLMPDSLRSFAAATPARMTVFMCSALSFRACTSRRPGGVRSCSVVPRGAWGRMTHGLWRPLNRWMPMLPERIAPRSSASANDICAFPDRRSRRL